MNHQFKINGDVWMSEYSTHDAKSLQTIDCLGGLYVSDAGKPALGGYTLVGTAEVVVTIASQDDIITGKVASLRAELERDRAESQARQNALIRKISELEALTYEVPA